MKREARKTHHFAGQTEFELERKRVRNVNLRVRADGSVYVSAPQRVPLAEIERFVASKEPWIAQKRELMQRRATQRAQFWKDGETTLLWGEPLAIRLVEAPSSRREEVRREGDELVLAVASRWSDDAEGSVSHRKRLVEAWRRDQLSSELPALFADHEAQMGVHATGVRLRSMKTRWGSCNVRTGTITLNTQLVEHPRECLEYVVVHELCHLHEPSHNARFHSLMDRYFPGWKAVRRKLRS